MGMCWPCGSRMGGVCPRCGNWDSDLGSEASLHLGTCPMRTVRCPNQWCGNKVTAKDYHSHRQECDLSGRVRCLRCDGSFPPLVVAVHEAECAPVRCLLCGEMVLRRLLKHCPAALIRRPPRPRPAAPAHRGAAAAVRLQRFWRRRRVRLLFDRALWGLLWRALDKSGERAVGPVEWGEAKRRRPPAPSPAASTGAPAPLQPQPSSPSELSSAVAAQLRCMPPAQAAEVVSTLRGALRSGKLPAAFCIQILREAITTLSEMPNVQRIPIPAQGEVVVVGDLHGHYEDLEHVLSHAGGEPGERRAYIFNGDFVDRGSRGVEVMVLLSALCVAYPRSVFVNRGNHEDQKCNHHYGFYQEVAMKLGAGVYGSVFVPLFRAMPLCAVVGGSIFVCHGGLPRDAAMRRIEDIDEGINRFRDVPDFAPAQCTAADRAFVDLLWSDPVEEECSWRANVERGAGVLWGQTMTMWFLTANPGIICIVRSHDPPPGGVSVAHSGKVYTVFSASNYMGVDDNAAAVLRFAAAKPGNPGTFKGAPIAISWESWRTPSELTVESAAGGEAEQGTRGAVLHLLRQLVHDHAHHLLSVFGTLDPTGTGAVWRTEWVHACAEVIDIPGLPWYMLCQHLCPPPVSDGPHVRYTSFLRRCGIAGELRLWQKWRPYCVTWVHFRAAALRGAPMGVLWGEAAARRGDPRTLHYDEFVYMLTHKLQIALSSRTVLLLYNSIDTHGRGVLMREDWDAASRLMYRVGVLFEEVRDDHRERSTFHMWDLWLLRRLTALCAPMHPHRAFATLDGDGDGDLSVADLRAAVRRLGVPELFRREQVYLAQPTETEAEVAALFGLPTVDLPSPTPDWAPYRRVVVQTWPLTDHQLQCFRASLDFDGDGRLGLADFSAATRLAELH
eukprot:TRINITY_DN1865_c1_g1_i1.p1 TRINITY_DN1865_c1_g1~~TRINITY_DN1865_c1_g1_i1.p1  ORF type:complete len:927 (+),score=194.14 TRINITY_DN1865_c1_g1_i1:96-2783(+)